MKKILLGLFLGLTALSFSAPSFVNVKEIERICLRVKLQMRM